MKYLGLSVLVGILFSASLFAHGEDQLGPHKGFIRMPGAFHTELVIQSRAIRVYLLDIEWKNPTNQKSSVDVFVRQKSKIAQTQCLPKRDFFECPLPAGVKLNSGEIVVTAKRENLPEATATYKLPLQLSKSVKQADSHKNHH